MIANIDQQHEEVINALGQYWEELIAWRRSFIRFALRRPIEFVKLALPVLRARRKNAPIDILSGRTGKEIQAVAPKFADPSRSPAEQGRLVDLLEDYSVHVIAQKILLAFPNCDFSKIKKLHDSRRTARLKLSTTKLVTGVLTVAAFLGKSVPKSIVENDFCLKYELFEKVLFYATIILVLYFGIIVVSEWITVRKHAAKHDFIGRILFYLDLITSKPQA